jgi:hypothetical protein
VLFCVKGSRTDCNDYEINENKQVGYPQSKQTIWIAG